MSFPATQTLAALLRHREAVIADHAWRERDPSGQLAELARVSGEIDAWTAQNAAQLDARLRHYLTQASFQKALLHIETAAGA
jgi:hypothetical protein